jgi:hypothetical protein
MHDERTLLKQKNEFHIGVENTARKKESLEVWCEIITTVEYNNNRLLGCDGAPHPQTQLHSQERVAY